MNPTDPACRGGSMCVRCMNCDIIQANQHFHFFIAISAMKLCINACSTFKAVLQ